MIIPNKFDHDDALKLCSMPKTTNEEFMICNVIAGAYSLNGKISCKIYQQFDHFRIRYLLIEIMENNK